MMRVGSRHILNERRNGDIKKMSSYRLYGLKKRRTPIVLVFTLYCLFFTLIGCEAFVRKFTRKPKEIKKEEPVIQPEVYPEALASKEQLYKDYFLFWQTWADELSAHLNEKANAKKQKECAYEALDNLMKLEPLLNEEKAKALEPLLNEFKTVKNIIFAGHLNSPDFDYLRVKVERIKSKVHRSFVFLKARKDLK